MMATWHTVDSMALKDSEIAILLRLVAEDRAESAPPQTDDDQEAGDDE